MTNKCKKMDLVSTKKKLINAYKRDKDPSPILEKIEDNFHIDLTKQYGEDNTKKINNLFKKLKTMQKKGYEC